MIKLIKQAHGSCLRFFIHTYRDKMLVSPLSVFHDSDGYISNMDESSIGAGWIMKTIKNWNKKYKKSKIKDFILNGTMVKAEIFWVKEKIKVYW